MLRSNELRERLANRTPAPSAQALSVAARPPGKTLERVLIRHEGRVHVLPMDRIDFVEAQDDYLEFASGGKRYRKQQTMSDLESQVDPTRFVRIHRSFIMNIERLSRIDLYGKDSWLAILVGWLETADVPHRPRKAESAHRLGTALRDWHWP